jgi:hypothetical protein
MKVTFLICSLLVTFSIYSQDTIVTKNERRYIGEIKSQDSDKIYFKTRNGNDVEINKDKIVSMSSSNKAETKKEAETNILTSKEDTLSYLIKKHNEIANNVYMSGKFFEKTSNNSLNSTYLSLAGSVIIFGATISSISNDDRAIFYSLAGTLYVGAMYEYFLAINNHRKASKRLKKSDGTTFK